MTARTTFLATAAIFVGCAGPAAAQSEPSLSASFRQARSSGPRYLLTWAIRQAQEPDMVYSPFISVPVRQFRITPRWPAATIAYQPGASVAGPGHLAIVIQDIALLDDAIGRPVFRLVPAGATADIVLTETYLPPASRLLGMTSLETSSWLRHDGLAISLSQTVAIAPGLDDNLFQKVALHELGHAAGLDHSPDRDSLMYSATRDDSPGDFGAAEKASLRLLYSLPDAPLVAAALGSGRAGTPASGSSVPRNRALALICGATLP